MQSGGKYASKMRAAIYSVLSYPYDRGVSASAIYRGKLNAAAPCAFSAAFNFFLPFPTPTNAATRTYAPAVCFAPQNARKRGGFAASAAALCERSGAGAHYLGQKRHGESARNCTREALIKSGMQIAQTDFS